MARWPKFAGIALGLAAACAVLLVLDLRSRPRQTGPILSECDGQLSSLVIQYEPSSRPIVQVVYREFLSQLDADVTIHVVCPDHKAYAELASFVGSTRCKLVEVSVGHSMTTWARDRWAALAPVEADGPATLLGPCNENGADVWAARAGDLQIAADLAGRLSNIGHVASRLYFDGGDFLADGRNVFVTPAVFARNIQRTVADKAELVRTLEAVLHKHVIVMEKVPDHHAGMFMMAAGDNTMLVGDPGLAKKVAWDRSLLDSGGGFDDDPQTQSRFDAVAELCAASGYTVVRMPVAPARDGRTYLTYLNGIIDQQGTRRTVYMPTYRGVELLTASARAVWEKLGYQVRPVDCTGAYRNFGSLHCLVNVMRRK